MDALTEYSEKTFEEIKHIDEDGNVYWFARELSKILQYADWRNFENAIYKAMDACKNSGYDVESNFGDITTFTKLSNGRMRRISDYALSRYACYLIVMNGDPQKEVIAAGQTYFAVQTRKQELLDEYDQLTEDQRRLSIRGEIRRHNTSLAEAAHDAGVETPLEYAVFQNYGYMGLYGGLKAQDIRRRKGLNDKQEILDHMGSTELAANLFRATQTDEKLRRDETKGKDAANKVHLEVGRTIRRTIEELGGTMPEDLPTPEKSIKQLEQEQRKKLKK